MSLEYVTGAESVAVFDAIVVHILNTDDLAGSARLVVFQNAVGGSVVFADTGELSISPNTVVSVGVSALTNGLYWLKIFMSSRRLVPNALFLTQQGSQTVRTTYAPGDFAVFERVRHVENG